MLFSSREDATQMPWCLATQPGLGVAVRLAAQMPGALPRVAAMHVLELNGPVRARLERLAEALGLKRARLHLLQETGAYQFLQSELPQVPAAELRTALRWRVKDMLAQPVEETTLDVVLPEHDEDEAAPRGGLAYVVAAPNALIRERMLMFRPWSSSVEVIDVVELAQRNLADALEEPGRATAVLTITQTGAMLSASQAGELFFVRNFDVSCGGLNASAAVRRDLFDRFVLELQRSFDVLERQHSARAISALWVAPFAHAEELRRLLVESLYLPVRPIALDAIFDVADCPLPAAPDHQAALVHALGMSLRGREVRA